MCRLYECFSVRLFLHSVLSVSPVDQYRTYLRSILPVIELFRGIIPGQPGYVLTAILSYSVYGFGNVPIHGRLPPLQYRSFMRMMTMIVVDGGRCDATMIVVVDCGRRDMVLGRGVVVLPRQMGDVLVVIRLCCEVVVRVFVNVISNLIKEIYPMQASTTDPSQAKFME